MSKLKNGSIKTIIVVTLIALFSEFFGFLRDVLIAYRYGTGVVSDTYFVVAGITILLFNLLANAVITMVIPIMAQIEIDRGKAAKIKYTSRIMTLIGLISLGIVILVEIFSPLIIKVIGSGFSSNQFNLAVKLLRLGIPGIIFSSLVGVLAGYLQSEGKYYVSSSTRIAFNLTCIVYLIFFADEFWISGLMIAAVIGTMAQFLLLRHDLKVTGYSYKFSLKKRDPYLNKILRLSIPVFMGIAIYDLNTMLDRTFASTLFIGNISQLTYANKIETLVISIFVSGITTVTYPEISEKVAENDTEGLKTVFQRAINTCLLIAIPATFGLIIFAQPIVRVLYQRGEFNLYATSATARVLIFYALGLIAKSMREVIVRIFYAIQETGKTLFNGILTLLINLVLNFAVIPFRKVELLALTTSVAILISTLILLYQLRLKIGRLGLKNSLLTGIKSLIAAFIMAIIAFFTYKVLLTKIDPTADGLFFLILALTILLAVVVYFLLAYLLKIKEVRETVSVILKKYKK